jgi:hypothetical protein
MVTVNPRYPRQVVGNAINDALTEAADTIFGVRDLDPIVIDDEVALGYPLPADTLRVLRVDLETDGPPRPPLDPRLDAAHLRRLPRAAAQPLRSLLHGARHRGHPARADDRRDRRLRRHDRPRRRRRTSPSTARCPTSSSPARPPGCS